MLHEPYIELVDGGHFEFLDPKPDQIKIETIAWALAHQCRFNGHCKKFYSVAEHCVLVSAILPNQHQLQGLLHDAAEAFLSDIPSPVKQFLQDYKKLEEVVEKAIFTKFNVKTNIQKEVKEADIKMLSTEAHYLLPSKGDTWTMWETIPRPAIQPEYQPLGLSPSKAFSLYLQAYHRYSGVPVLDVPEKPKIIVAA